MIGKREQPGSNDEFNVGGLGTASVRRNGLAHERSRLVAHGDGVGGRTALGGCLTSAATTIPARSTLCSSWRLRSLDIRIGHRGRASRRRKDGTSSLRLVSRGGDYPRELSDGLAEHHARSARIAAGRTAGTIGGTASAREPAVQDVR